jgi:ABC-2 type transport system permease protein
MRGAILAVIERELKRFVRQRGRLLATFLRPMLWLVVIGSGFSAVVHGGVSYFKYLLPGIYGMVIMFSTFLSALGTVHDREFGPMRMLLIAPLPRSVVVLAKTAAAATLGFVQAVALLPIVWIVGLRPPAEAIFAFIGWVALGSVTLASVAMLLASRIRSIENFAIVMNLVLFPMFFLSGALYPASSLAGYLQPFVRGNPLTYAIDGMRHSLLHGTFPGNLGPEYTMLFDGIVLAAFAAITLALAVQLFGEEEHLGRVLLTGAPKRKFAFPRPGFGRAEKTGQNAPV